MLTKWFTPSDTDFICVWTLPDKRSAYFTEIAEAEKYALSLPDKDVYFHVGTSREKTAANRRWTAENITAIPGLWADIDYVCEGSINKKRIPKDRAAADAILAALPWKPTLLVHSGHGLQAFWKFKEPWDISTPEQHQRATAVAKAWNHYLQRIAGSFGFVLDSVADLARVMRMPGTTNHKSKPVLAVLEAETDTFIDLDTIDEIIGSVEAATQKFCYTVDGIVLDAGAEPPGEKLVALIANEPKARQTWDRTRKDLADTSASAYDMALANYAAIAGWTCQEICNLLIANRRRWGDEPKTRESYLVRTAMKAITRHEQAVAIEQADKVLIETVESDAPMDEKRAKAMDHLSKAFGLKTLRIIKYLSDPPIYRLVTETGQINLGGPEGIRSQQRFADSVMAATNKLIPPFKAAQWRTIVVAMLAILEEQEVGHEATDMGMTGSWLNDYLSSKTVEKEPGDLLIPYNNNGKVRIFANDFMRWVNIHHGKNYSPRMVGVLLRTSGCKPAKVHVNGTTRSVWELP